MHARQLCSGGRCTLALLASSRLSWADSWPLPCWASRQRPGTNSSHRNPAVPSAAPCRLPAAAPPRRAAPRRASEPVRVLHAALRHRAAPGGRWRAGRKRGAQRKGRRREYADWIPRRSRAEAEGGAGGWRAAAAWRAAAPASMLRDGRLAAGASECLLFRRCESGLGAAGLVGRNRQPFWVAVRQPEAPRDG